MQISRNLSPSTQEIHFWNVSIDNYLISKPHNSYSGFRFYLKEVALFLSREGAGVELSSLVLPFFVDYSEDCRATMGHTTRMAGTGRNCCTSI